MLSCPSGHSFDIARQGYANLLPGDAQARSADTPEMVAARSAFLSAGHFAPLSAALADVTERAVASTPGCVVDAGAGTGEYLAEVLDRLPGRSGLALDISKYAARRAARAHPRIGAIVCDAWGALPVRDSVAAAVLSIFAPRNPAEFARILVPGGVLIVAAPTPRHLQELIAPLGMVSVDPRKEERLEGALSGHFAREGAQTVERMLAMSRADALSAARMGPSAYHVEVGESQRRAAALTEPVEATLSVIVSVWRMREE
jgi:23S rRNA (guanine745-N1)-methyltransferase